MAAGPSVSGAGASGESDTSLPDFAGLEAELCTLEAVSSEKDGLESLTRLRERVVSITAILGEDLWSEVCQLLLEGPPKKKPSAEAEPVWAAIKLLVVSLVRSSLKKAVREVGSSALAKGVVGIIRQLERSPVGHCAWVQPKLRRANKQFRNLSKRLRQGNESDAQSRASEEPASAKQVGTRGRRKAAPLARRSMDPAACKWPAEGWADKARSPSADGGPAHVVCDARHGMSSAVEADLTAVAVEAADQAVAGPERTDEFLAIAAELQAEARRHCRGSGHRVALYGSVVTGLASASSDLDCVFVGTSGRAAMTADQVRAQAEKSSGKPRRRGVFAAPPPMKDLERELKRDRRSLFKVVEAIGFARIPILRLLHTPTKTDIDLSFNSIVGVHNSRLLRSYMGFDLLRRAPRLVTLVKRWAKRRNINDSSRDTLSSYAYTLMVVFFLQQRGVLPNLQAPGLLGAYEEWRGKRLPPVTVHGFRLRYCADDKFLGKLAESRLECGRLSTESLGSLLLGFFTFYANTFDWENHAVSVRLGQPRARKGWAAGVRGRMGIEDPFEDERDLCATLGKDGQLRGQARILRELNRARDVMMRGLSGDASKRGAKAALAELMDDG